MEEWIALLLSKDSYSSWSFSLTDSSWSKTDQNYKTVKSIKWICLKPIFRNSPIHNFPLCLKRSACLILFSLKFATNLKTNYRKLLIKKCSLFLLSPSVSVYHFFLYLSLSLSLIMAVSISLSPFLFLSISFFLFPSVSINFFSLSLFLILSQL